MGPLTGIHVLDFSRLAPGPYCSMLLADMGAAVVRVDRAPLGSDIPPFVGDVLGRGKRSVALNLKHDEGARAARRLADACGRRDRGLPPRRDGALRPRPR